MISWGPPCDLQPGAVPTPPTPPLSSRPLWSPSCIYRPPTLHRGGWGAAGATPISPGATPISPGSCSPVREHPAPVGTLPCAGWAACVGSPGLASRDVGCLASAVHLLSQRQTGGYQLGALLLGLRAG